MRVLILSVSKYAIASTCLFAWLWAGAFEFSYAQVTSVSVTLFDTDVKYDSGEVRINFTTNDGVDDADSIFVRFPVGFFIANLNGATEVRYPNNNLNGNNDAVYWRTLSDGRTEFVMSPNNNQAAGAGILRLRDNADGYVRNPAAGDYTVDVATTDEPTFVTSSVFTVSGIFDLVGTSVTVTPTGTRQAAQWTLSATTSGTANTNVRANIDSIQIIFPDGVTLPSEIDPSDITVNDVSVSSLDDIDISSGNTVTFLSPVSIGTTLYFGGDPELPADPGTAGSFTIRFLASAAIENPDVTGTYPVKIRTISGNNKIASNDKNFQFLQGDYMDSSFTTYTVTTNNDSTSTSTVSIAPALADTIAAYTIVFNSGSGGKLTQNSGTITITFPTGTTVPPGTISGILINDNTVTDASGDSSARTLTLVTPIDIANSEVVTVEIPTGASIRNPSGGTYTLRVATSSLPNNTISDQYVINPTNVLAFSSVSVSPNVVNTVAEYTIEFLTGTTGALASADSIYLVFPRHTTLPANISVSSAEASRTIPLKLSYKKVIRPTRIPS